ncbi:ribosomal protein S5 alanine N-acetyltransferase [Leucobacter sp. Psy1]|uniref:GNAT family N-acetyltransferase n=1 Tax=Leucobacter sp. Psy1 TaxID=2875729 RepID=UPI001CD4FC40|nr:GNAT family protein [Leucobacter sp. Psy1]UBH07448.1 ribosomal protein S5 alanine N-acetyltransferase [Leucobacter sp. Psy1]
MTRIRLIEPADAETLASLLARDREFLLPWEPIRADAYFTAPGQQAEIRALLEQHERGEVVPFVMLNDEERVVGRVTLNGIVRGPFQSCSVGYWLTRASRGRGLATFAVAAAVDHAFTEIGLHRVQAEVMPDNTASRRVLERNRFSEYGYAPRYLQIAGSWEDHLMFQRLADDPAVT